MKRTFIFLTIVILLFCFVFLTSCQNDEAPSAPVMHKVKIGSKVYEVADGETLAPKLTTYQKSLSYYTSKTGSIEWDIYRDPVTCDITLYARKTSD